MISKQPIRIVDRMLIFVYENRVNTSTSGIPPSLNKRFLQIAPFSKFYMEQDNLSPGGVGIWVGWQIVTSYMKHNDVSLQQLLQINELDLFKKSKYKPRK